MHSLFHSHHIQLPGTVLPREFVHRGHGACLVNLSTEATEHRVCCSDRLWSLTTSFYLSTDDQGRTPSSAYSLIFIHLPPHHRPPPPHFLRWILRPRLPPPRLFLLQLHHWHLLHFRLHPN